MKKNHLMPFTTLFLVINFLVQCTSPILEKTVPEVTEPLNASSEANIDTIIKTTVLEKVVTETNTTVSSPSTDSIISRYCWLDDYSPNSCVALQIPPPNGYKREKCDEKSFEYWLRHLPLLPKGSPVLLYDKQQKPYQEGAARVLNIDIGNRDLQQCADAVMRLKAEYEFSNKAFDAIHFNYTSGHTIRFSDWAMGKKPKVSGSKVTFSSPNGGKDYSYSNFKKYLKNVYMFAGTASLEKELKESSVSSLKAGDVFIKGGFPGHAIIVLDVAIHTESGKKVFLLAQSYMPAQSIHILKNFNDPDLSPWYSEDFGDILYTPEWSFERNQLKRFD